MAISVIIPALNEEDYLPRLLRSFAEQEYKGEYEIVVVDGESTDGTKDVVSRYQEKLSNLSVYSCKAGISRQRNLGASKAKYDNLIFLDADTEVGKRSLAKIERHFSTKRNFTAIPILFPYDGKIIDIYYGLLVYGYLFAVRKTHPSLVGMCIVTTKEVHERIGGFDERAVVAEDVDYSLRAFASGAKYYILFDVLIRGSARRLDKLGRSKVAQIWKRWYLQTVESGPITDVSQYDYEFGKFKK